MVNFRGSIFDQLSIEFSENLCVVDLVSDGCEAVESGLQIWVPCIVFGRCSVETYRLPFHKLKMVAIHSSEMLVTTYKTTIDLYHGVRCLTAFFLAVALHVLCPIITMAESKVHDQVSRFWHVIKVHVMRKLC